MQAVLEMSRDALYGLLRGGAAETKTGPQAQRRTQNKASDLRRPNAENCMSYRKRVDSTQKAIVEALQQTGATVLDLSKTGIGGCPDLLVGRVMPCPFCGAYTPRNILIECKAGRGKLNKLQEEFHASWRGPIVVAKTIEEALAAVGINDGRGAVLAALGEREK